MIEDRSWEGHWRVRLEERVRARGYASLTDFAEARPAIPLHVLAEELGAQDIAGVQVLRGLLVEAERNQRVTRFVRDVLVRELADYLPEGWPSRLDDPNRFKVAMALGCWSTDVPKSHKDRVQRAVDVLLSTTPPAGWRPLGPDDELLCLLLPDEEG